MEIFEDIFTDPITKIHYEGRARIMKTISECKFKEGKLSYCMVRFNDAPTFIHKRYIYKRSA